MHGNVVEEFENYVKTSERRGKKRKLNNSNVSNNTLQQQKLYLFSNESKQKKFDKNILNYVVCSMKPLSTVEDEHFIKMINGMYTVYIVYLYISIYNYILYYICGFFPHFFFNFSNLM